MPVQVWLLRHGEAIAHEAQPDFDRRLTPRGERQAAFAGRALALIGLEFAACYTSPRVRARDTARIACDSLGVEPEEVDVLAGDFDRDGLAELLHGHDGDDRVLLVGHEPDFSQLVHDLTGGRIDMKKGGVAAVVMTPAPQLLTLLRPRELETVAVGTDGA